MHSTSPRSPLNAGHLPNSNRCFPFSLRIFLTFHDIQRFDRWWVEQEQRRAQVETETEAEVWSEWRFYAQANHNIRSSRLF